VSEEFWQARPELTTIRKVARERRVGPWALLGAVLAHVAADTGPHVVLPPLIGGEASLNLLVGLVGPSGGGKDAALSVAEELVVPEFATRCIPTVELATGQGVAAAYVTMNKDTGGIQVQYRDAALFTASEIDNVAAHAAMGGSNLMPILRRAYTGSRLDEGYADKAKRRPVKAHRYRFALVAGIQPARSRVLLGDADGGTPQRWLWLPTNDPDAVDAEPEPFGLFLASGCLWKPRPEFEPVGEVEIPPAIEKKSKIVLEVCETVRADVDAARVKRLAAELTTRGEELLAGHKLLSREKVAALLGILSRSDAKVDEEDWSLAGEVMSVSDATRKACEGALAESARRENRARGKADAEREGARQDGMVQRVARILLRKLRGGEWVRGSDLRRGLTSASRGYLEPAVELLLDTGQIQAEAVEYNGRPGNRYRRVD
jgi:hypothetical protein